VGVCYRLPDWENRVDETLYKQIGAVSHSQNMVLIGDFNHPDICWMDNIAVHQKSKSFLECVDDNFLFQVVQEPTRKGGMLDHVPTKEEGLVSIVKLKGSLGCSDHRMVEFKSIGCQRGRAASLLHWTSEEQNSPLEL